VDIRLTWRQRAADRAIAARNSRYLPGPGAFRDAAGFTLLEILVVLLIIGVIVTFATLSSGVAGREKQTDNDVQRLIALMGLAGEEAVLRTRQLAVEFGEHDYRFLRYESGAWAPLDDELLRPRELPPDVEVDLVLEGKAIVLQPPKQEDGPQDAGGLSDQETPTANPQIIFLSSGESTPFDLTLTDEVTKKRYLIKGDPIGNIVLENTDQRR